MHDAGFIPALRFHSLTPLFDAVAAVAVRDRVIKRRVLHRAQIAGGDAVLDVGCGIGTVAVAAARSAPGVRVARLDADPSILDRARAGATARRARDRVPGGRSTALPSADGSFDLVLSTLFLHHLADDAKRQTAAEVARVVCATVQLLDGVATTALNVRGELPDVLAGAGMGSVEVRDRVCTPTGTYEIITATRRAGMS